MLKRPGGRFLSSDDGSVKRRYWRNYRRESRSCSGVIKKRPSAACGVSQALKRPAASACGVSQAPAAGTDDRTGSRHRFYPCCGKRRNQCSCDWTWYRSRLREGRLREFLKTVASSELLRGSDTADTGWFLARVACPTSSASSLQEASLARFWWACIAFRRFSNPDTWEAMERAVLRAPPNWEGVRAALQERADAGETLFGGRFYPSVLKRYREEGAAWKAVPRRMSTVDREVLTLQLLHASVPSKACAAYERDPGRAAFAAICNETSEGARAKLSGVWSHYALKCALDVLTLSGRVPDCHISTWPTDCPSYGDALADMFKAKVDKDSRYEAFCFLFYEAGTQHGGKLRFAEFCMHLCWNIRRASGKLNDVVQ